MPPAPPSWSEQQARLEETEPPLPPLPPQEPEEAAAEVPLASLDQVRPGATLQVLRDRRAVVDACRDADLDLEGTYVRKAMAGQRVRVIGKDPTDQTVLVKCGAAEPVWIPLAALRPPAKDTFRCIPSVGTWYQAKLPTEEAEQAEQEAREAAVAAAIESKGAERAARKQEALAATAAFEEALAATAKYEEALAATAALSQTGRTEATSAMVEQAVANSADQAIAALSMTGRTEYSVVTVDDGGTPAASMAGSFFSETQQIVDAAAAVAALAVQQGISAEEAEAILSASGRLDESGKLGATARLDRSSRAPLGSVPEEEGAQEAAAPPRPAGLQRPPVRAHSPEDPQEAARRGPLTNSGATRKQVESFAQSLTASIFKNTRRTAAQNLVARAAAARGRPPVPGETATSAAAFRASSSSLSPPPQQITSPTGRTGPSPRLPLGLPADENQLNF